jgi:hypothetical protein
MTSLIIATGQEFARLSPKGNSWETRVSLSKSKAQCLAHDPIHPEITYIGTHGNGLWKSQDAGENWKDVNLPAKDIFSVAISPVDGSVYAGCEPSMLFRSRDDGKTWEELSALRELPSAPTWSFPPRPWTSHVRWVAPSPHDADTLLAGIELGGLMLSQDGGVTWLDHRPGAQRDVHALAWHPTVPGRAYQAGGGGAAWSKDNGVTWQPADTGRDRHYTWALAIHPMDPDCWFLSASTGPRAAHGSQDAQGFIYRWRGDGPWQALAGGLPQPLKSMPYALAMHQSRVYAGLSNGQIWTSEDEGDHWQRLEMSGEPLTRIEAMIYVP